MFPLKVLLIVTALTIFGGSAALVGYDIYLAAQLNRLLPRKRGFRGGSPLLAVTKQGRPSFSEIAVARGHRGSDL
jgi:hypothetical protein